MIPQIENISNYRLYIITDSNKRDSINTF